MIGQLQIPEKLEGRRAKKRHGDTHSELYQTIPDRVDFVAHPEYLRMDAEEVLFGPGAAAIVVPPWRPSLEIDEGLGGTQPQPRTNLSREDEALLFRRYNCARHRLASLMEKQARRFSHLRVSEILTWHRRVTENQTALTQANMALVVAMARRMRTTTVDFTDLVSEGNMALLRAMDKFDFSRGFKFSTYACGAILRAFSRLASQAGTYRQRFPNNSEPDSEPGHESDQRHIDQHDLALEDLRRALTHNRGGLTDVERTVLGARFAVAGHARVHTLREVSRLVRLSGERVRQVQNGALAKLRAAMEPVSTPAAAAMAARQ